jgi:hypothetical protein
MLVKVSLDKTPGYPLNLTHGTNFSALKADSREIVNTAVARLLLWTMPKTSDYALTLTPFELIKFGFTDPTNVFMKKEPHPLRKIHAKLYRCISGVSLVDNLVEAALFTKSSELIRERGVVGGSAIGIGFTDEQNKQFFAAIERINSNYGPPMGLDGSGYDAWHTEEALEATHYIDVEVHSPSRIWIAASRVWVYVAARAVAVVGSTLHAKTVFGMINSGSKDTSRRNTTLSLFYARYVGLLLGNRINHVLANGDDTLVWGDFDGSELEEAYSSFGAKVRDVDRFRDELHFCSHHYFKSSDGTVKAALTSWPKALYACLVKEMRLDDAFQVANEIRHNDDELYRKFIQLFRFSFASELSSEQ